MSKHHDLTPALARQRRNLMIASILLIFLQASQASFDSVVVMGLSVTFGRPDAVPAFAIAFSVYFAYRYALYLYQEPELKLSNEFLRRFNGRISPTIRKLREEKFPGIDEPQVWEPLRRFPVSSLWKGIKVSVVSEKANHYGHANKTQIGVPLQLVAIDLLKSAAEAIALRSYFTDYVLPLVLVGVAWIVTFL